MKRTWSFSQTHSEFGLNKCPNLFFHYCEEVISYLPLFLRLHGETVKVKTENIEQKLKNGKTCRFSTIIT